MGAALAEQGAEKDNGMAAEWASMIDDGLDDDSRDLAGADRVLNQEEIDQLVGFSLHELSASGASGIRAIVDSGVISYERLPMLEIIFDRMIRLLSTSLRNFFQDNVEVTLDNITSVRFGDYLNSIPLPVQLAVFKAEGWDNSGLITVESNLAYSALDLLLGGKRGGSAARLDGRPFTTIETQLIKRMVEVVLTDAEHSFQPLSPVRFKVDRMETNPRFATITRPANAAILIDLSSIWKDAAGSCRSCCLTPRSNRSATSCSRASWARGSGAIRYGKSRSRPRSGRRTSRSRRSSTRCGCHSRRCFRCRSATR